MSLKIRSTRVACATSNGTQDITITDFGTPVAALFILQNTTADATAVDQAVLSFGATDGTRNWVNGFNSEHGQDTSDTDTRHSTSYCVRTYSNADGTAECYASFSAWITDGVRINWDSAPSAACLLTVVLFGGTDLTNAYAGTYTQSGTVDGSTDVTDPGFRPTDLILSRIVSNAATNGINIGVVHENGSGTVTQGCASFIDRGGQGTTQLGSRITNTYGIATGVYDGTFYAPQDINTFDASGFSSTTKVSNTAATTGVVCYLALRITNYSSYKGSFTTPTSTGNQSQTGPSFKPQFLLQICGGYEAVDTAYTDNRAGTFAVSAADATAQYCNSWASEDAADTSNTESQSDDQMVVLHDDDGSALIATTFVSFDTNGWTQNFTAASATGKVWLVWAVEEEAASGPTNITPAEASQSQTSDAVSIVAISPIVPAEATQAQLSDAASITASGPTYPITAEEATQAQASDAASITAISPVTPSEATQAQVSDAASITAIYVIAPAEATQAQTSDAATLGQFTPITPAEATQAQTSDAVTITAIYPLAPAEATQPQTSDSATITAIYPITVSEATQAQTSDAAVLTGAGEYAIAPAEAVQAQTSDAVTLAVVYPVTPAEATQAQTSDAASIAYYSPGVNITPAEATQSQTADAPSLSVIYVVTVADATQAQTSDIAVLTSPVTAYPPGRRRLLEPDERSTGEMAVRANSVFATRSNLEVDD